MSVLDKLLIKNQTYTDESFIDSKILKSKIEAIASIHNATMFLVEQRTQEFLNYNFNPVLYNLLNDDDDDLNLKKIHAHIKSPDQYLISKYVDIINQHFLNKSKIAYQRIYFTIEHAFEFIKEIEGASITIFPYLYDSDNNLLATVGIVKPISFAGSPILRKHNLKEKTTSIYDHTSKTFIPERDSFLSKQENTIIHLSGHGVKEKDIAKQLDMTLSGLKKAKAILFEKLKVNSITEAIFVASKRGYINIDNDIDTF